MISEFKYKDYPVTQTKVNVIIYIINSCIWLNKNLVILILGLQIEGNNQWLIILNVSQDAKLHWKIEIEVIDTIFFHKHLNK